MQKAREATFEERSTWGVCPTCGAQPGQKCDPTKGIPLGMPITGVPARDGAHLSRLRAAPKRVQLIGA